MSRLCVIALLLASVTTAGFAQQTTFPGTVSGGVGAIDTHKLLDAMNKGNGTFVAVAAHRGYWQGVPENSVQAIQAAYNAGIEAVEIDVRLATTDQETPFTTGAPYGQLKDQVHGGLVLSHDECIRSSDFRIGLSPLAQSHDEPEQVPER